MAHQPPKDVQDATPASGGPGRSTATDAGADTAHGDAPASGSLVSLTYTSSVTRLMPVTELVELIEQIRPKNERLGVTGLLLYSGGHVIQTLEGTAYAVDAVFDAIRADARHGDVHVLERRAIDARSYATWSMGFRNVSAREVDGLQDFGTLARESVGHDLTPHAASAFELLERFRVNAV